MRTRVEHTDDFVIIRLGPIDAVLALKARLDVPVGRITRVEVMDRSAVPSTPGTLLRAPGTRIPGLIRHGSYGVTPTREFWAVFRQPKVVVVDVTDWDYHRLILGSTDPDDLASALRTGREPVDSS